jgi:hypothetical protein
MHLPIDRFTFLFASTALALPAIAQTSAPSNVRQAALTRDESVTQVESVRFSRQPPHVGDQVEQRVALEMRLAISVRRDRELLESNELRMRNTQRRLVTTTEIVDGRTQAALVRYPEATKQHAVGEAARQSFDSTTSPVADRTVQPVQGKTYHCRREPGDEGQLVITDEAGNIPPLDEYEIVAQGMDSVGRANPLADYLADRTVSVGETLTLPREFADRLFGIKERFGDIARFDLKLTEVRSEKNAQHAVFHVHIDAASHDATQVRLQVAGPLVIEVGSCRAVQTKLSGPLAMTESRGTYSTAQFLTSAGQTTMSIDARFRDAER